MDEQQDLLVEPVVGYVCVCSRGEKHWGGLLVVNGEGDPVDFAHTDSISMAWPVKTLLGARLSGYLAARVVAGPLLAVVKVRPRLVCFDDPSVLDRNLELGIPAAVVVQQDFTPQEWRWRRVEVSGQQDDKWWSAAESVDEVTELLTASVECMTTPISEPFSRARKALDEMIQSQS